MKTPEKELELHFGDRLVPLDARDPPVPAGIGQWFGKIVMEDCTLTLGRNGFMVTTPSGESASCGYGDSRIEWPDLKALQQAIYVSGFGVLVIQGPPTLSIKLPTPVLCGLMTISGRWAA